MAVIVGVQRASIAEELEITPGDRLLAINGVEAKDWLHYQEEQTKDYVEILIAKESGGEVLFEIEKDPTEDIGLEFDSFLFDGCRVCRNKCLFCFVDQLPPGMRKNLYVKDDDYRLSFLQGTFITLTNLNGRDWQRIGDQRLSPLYISVHSIDPDVRERLLGNPRARLIGQQIQWLAAEGISFHAQIVLCPEINDGSVLEDTIGYLYRCHPALVSLAIVPVGLTKYSNRQLRAFTVDEARDIITGVEKWQAKAQRELGTRLVWAADEFYLQGQLPLPPWETYEGFPQYENGVGIGATFLREMEEINWDAYRHLEGQRVLLATGRLAAPLIGAFAARLGTIGIEAQVLELSNDYFGPQTTVAGLLTGRDYLRLTDLKEQGPLFLSAMSLKRGGNIFLDDVSLEELGEGLQREIYPVQGPEEVLQVLVGRSNGNG
ncbi:MAG: DUF512 domain-containing protein [Limnochordia bacterium]